MTKEHNCHTCVFEDKESTSTRFMKTTLVLYIFFLGWFETLTFTRDKSRFKVIAVAAVVSYVHGISLPPSGVAESKSFVQKIQPMLAVPHWDSQRWPWGHLDSVRLRMSFWESLLKKNARIQYLVSEMIQGPQGVRDPERLTEKKRNIRDGQVILKGWGRVI